MSDAVRVAVRTRLEERLRRTRIAGVAALTGLLAYVLLGVPIFVVPDVGPLPVRADAVVVLGGPTPNRLAIAEALYRGHRVGAMVWSTPTPWDVTGTPQQLAVADCGHEANLYCFTPDPSTTRGEARGFTALANRHHWRSIIVLGYVTHLERAHTIFARCFDGSISMHASDVPADLNGWAEQYAYQTGATIKMWLNPGC